MKGKRRSAAPAGDLYTSSLFVGRRRFVLGSCDRWFILSALHGLLDPEQTIEPYDRSLLDVGSGERRAWAKEVLAAIDATLGDVAGVVFELHAGAAYRDFGLVDGLRARGAEVVNPTAGLSQGGQLAFYAGNSELRDPRPLAPPPADVATTSQATPAGDVARRPRWASRTAAPGGVGKGVGSPVAGVGPSAPCVVGKQRSFPSGHGLAVGRLARRRRRHRGRPCHVPEGPAVTDPAADLNRFYELLRSLESAIGGRRTLSDCHGRMGWPLRGVYFFFEPGETRRDGTPRVTRVGPHALTSSSQSSLWGRLAQHRGRVGGRHAGGGNHRGSIFRRHVGRALLDRDGDISGVAATWGKGSSASRETVAAEHAHEVTVSAYLGSLPFLWLAVDDPPGRTSHRGIIERGFIGLLSRRVNPAADPPSAGWLGLHAPAPQIRTSGLWNVNHVDERYDSAFLDVLEAHILEAEHRG